MHLQPWKPSRECCVHDKSGEQRKQRRTKHMIPKDPMILLSYVNTQLRDYYDSLEALCTCRGLRKKELLEKMDSIDYHYDEKTNQFI